MINLYIVHRKYPGTDESVIGAFLVENHARQFAAECLRLSKSAQVWVAESCISTYGMSGETRQNLIEAVNSTLAGE